jgi:hypothetical protein
MRAYGAAYQLTDLPAHLARDCRAAVERTGRLGCTGPYLPTLGSRAAHPAAASDFPTQRRRSLDAR